MRDGGRGPEREPGAHRGDRGSAEARLSRSASSRSRRTATTGPTAPSAAARGSCCPGSTSSASARPSWASTSCRISSRAGSSTVRLDRKLMSQHALERWYAPAATTYRVSAAGPSSTRLVAKSVTAFPRGMRWRLARIPVKWADRLILKPAAAHAEAPLPARQRAGAQAPSAGRRASARGRRPACP